MHAPEKVTKKNSPGGREKFSKNPKVVRLIFLSVTVMVTYNSVTMVNVHMDSIGKNHDHFLYSAR